MRPIKQIAITAILMICTFCAVLYTSCSKSACSGVTCLNTGTCTGGMCTCPTGAGGNNCQTIYRLTYANPSSTYVGFGAKDTGSLHPDSATMVFTTPPDTIYSNMTLAIRDSSNHIFAVLPITLTNNSASGSTFVLRGTVALDTTVIRSGSGSISATTASLNLTIRDNTDTLYHTVSYSNFIKQK